MNNKFNRFKMHYSVLKEPKQEGEKKKQNPKQEVLTPLEKFKHQEVLTGTHFSLL